MNRHSRSQRTASCKLFATVTDSSRMVDRLLMAEQRPMQSA